MLLLTQRDLNSAGSNYQWSLMNAFGFGENGDVEVEEDGWAENGQRFSLEVSDRSDSFYVSPE